MDTQRTIVSRLLDQPMSLAALRDATGASLPTLRRAVQALRQAGWLHVAGREDDTGGRPARLYGVDPAHHVLIGVHLEHPGMRLVATDVPGTLLDETVPVGVADLDADLVIAEVRAYAERVRARFPERVTVGIGVASPGFIDPSSGAVIAIGRVPSWSNLPLRQRLADATRLPVHIGNDVDAMAAAEFGDAFDARTHVYVGFSEGIKYSLFLEGRLYQGLFGNAGLVPRGLLAEEGTQAGPAALLSVSGLVTRYLAAAAGDAPGAQRIAEEADPWARFSALLEVAESGRDDVARDLVAVLTQALAGQLASFVHLVQPQLLVLGGAMAAAPDGVAAAVESALRQRLPALLDNHLVLRRARVASPSSAAYGATRAFLQRFLRDPGSPLALLSRRDAAHADRAADAHPA